MRMVSCTVPLLVALILFAPHPASASPGEALERGVSQVRSGEYAVAVETLRGILEEDPGNRDARIWLARALSFSGDFPGAEEEYRKVLSAFPGDVEARLGLADVMAWQKRYREAMRNLADLEKERPDDPEVWVRMGKVELWSGKPEEAKRYFEKTLSLDPGNTEARKGLELIAARAARAYRREAAFGGEYLRMRRANPGSQWYAAIRDMSISGWEFLGRADYLHRYGRDEGRGTAGVMRKWEGGATARVEGALSPGAEIFSRASVEAELAWPIGAGLVGYAGGKYAVFSVVDSWNGVAGLEWYIPGSNALFARYILTRTEFDVGGASTDGTWTVRLTHFFTDDDRAWIYFARGAESYTTGTVDQLGVISSNTIELGGRIFPVPLWGVEGRVAWQDREDGNDYFTVAAVLFRRF